MGEPKFGLMRKPKIGRVSPSSVRFGKSRLERGAHVWFDLETQDWKGEPKFV